MGDATTNDMPAPLLKISAATLYDPANQVDGEVRDLWIADGKIVEAPVDAEARAVRTIDAKGLVAMPGGVDIHSHIAGAKPNAARLLSPGGRTGVSAADSIGGRSGTAGVVPSTFATGYLYAGLGYTTAFDAAVAPLDARHAHHELDDTPCLDKGIFTLMGNNHYVMRCIEQSEPKRLRHFIAWLLTAARGYAPKLVNPGGVETWKHTPANRAHGLDEPVPGFSISPRDILREVVAAANELQLPHPAHIHCNQLGMPGNWRTTLATMQAIEGRRAHLAHIQFHSYGGGNDDENTFCSRTAELADYINDHDNLTVDVGQVLFGDAMAMTGDGAAAYYLQKLQGGPWYNCDVECEAGCGVTPIRYRRRSLINALQWAIGLEWFLLVDDPWKVMMSTDHPNGASFQAYPQIVALLMDRELRREALDRCPPAVRQRSMLADLNRQYTLGEIATITRAAPARALGLGSKGHLGAGADADVVLYSSDDDRRRMFEMPRMVIKAGETIVDDGELRQAPAGETLSTAPNFDTSATGHIRQWFEENYSLRFNHYGAPIGKPM